MSRRRRGRPVHGVVLLDKPAGLSSNQALQKVRRIFDARKGGHTGSLDPFATGLLPICLGEATKTAGLLLETDKHYLATARLGEATETGDVEGRVVQRCEIPELSEDRIRLIFDRFKGKISQVPPMYSALKVQGRPLYELARAGKKVERKARDVEIKSLELVNWESPHFEFRVHCSKGTYIRTLAEDIAAELGTCAHLTALRRTRVGPFDGAPMVGLEELQRAADADELGDILLPVDSGLSAWPEVTLNAESTRRFRHGNDVPCEWVQPGECRVISSSGELIGLGKVSSHKRLRPTRVFQLGGQTTGR